IVTTNLSAPMRFPSKVALLFSCMLLSASGVRAELALVERWPTGGDVCADTPLRLTFNEPPVIGHAGKIEVFRAAGGDPVATVDLGATEHLDRFGATGGFLLRYEPILVDGKTASIR